MRSLVHTHTHTDMYSTELFNCEWFSFLTTDRPPTPTPFLSAQFKSKQKKHLVSLSIWTSTPYSEELRSTKRSAMTDRSVKTQPLERKLHRDLKKHIQSISFVCFLLEQLTDKSNVK